MRAIYPRHLNPIRWWWCMLRIETWWWWRWWWCSSSSYREGVKQTRWEHCDTSEIQTVKARGRGGVVSNNGHHDVKRPDFVYVCMWKKNGRNVVSKSSSKQKEHVCIHSYLYKIGLSGKRTEISWEWMGGMLMKKSAWDGSRRGHGAKSEVDT